MVLAIYFSQRSALPELRDVVITYGVHDKHLRLIPDGLALFAPDSGVNAMPNQSVDDYASDLPKCFGDVYLVRTGYGILISMTVADLQAYLPRSQYSFRSQPYVHPFQELQEASDEEESDDENEDEEDDDESWRGSAAELESEEEVVSEEEIEEEWEDDMI